MLGFNKYVIPFQRADQELPFNVAGLDTVKYTPEDFRAKASRALDQAIGATTPKGAEVVQPEGLLETFLLSRGQLVSDVTTSDGKALYGLGSPLGFNLLEDFTGTEYQYFGRFANLRPELALWRVAKLAEVLRGRRASLAKRVELV